MNIYDYFTLCEGKLSEKRTPLRRTSFALRRAGVKTVEMLCEMRRDRPEKLADIRDIGSQSISIVDEVLCFYESEEMSPKTRE